MSNVKLTPKDRQNFEIKKAVPKFWQKPGRVQRKECSCSKSKKKGVDFFYQKFAQVDPKTTKKVAVAKKSINTKVFTANRSETKVQKISNVINEKKTEFEQQMAQKMVRGGNEKFKKRILFREKKTILHRWYITGKKNAQVNIFYFY
jgi:hypothetical protein